MHKGVYLPKDTDGPSLQNRYFYPRTPNLYEAFSEEESGKIRELISKELCLFCKHPKLKHTPQCHHISPDPCICKNFESPQER